MHLLVDDGLRIRLDLVVVALYLLEHDVVTFLVLEFVDDRYLPVSFLLGTDLVVVNDDFGMENLLFYLLAEVVRYGSYKGALREVGNLGRGNERVKLRVDGGGYVLAVDGYGLPLLEYFPKRSESVFAVSPTTWPLKILPTVFWITLDSFSP